MKVFITGTDTDSGKTYVSCAILNWLNQAEYATIGSKPIASGCSFLNGRYVNDDALALQQASSIKLDYDIINPIALPEPTAPHIAANQRQMRLSSLDFANHLRAIDNIPSDFHLIEGAGGWLVPVNEEETLGDIVAQLNIPVILVVGVRLGCINHSLLTAHAIHSSGAKLIGWIANCIDPNMLYLNETIASIESRITAPRLATVGYNEALTRTEKFYEAFIAPPTDTSPEECASTFPSSVFSNR